jgi:UPF0716 protein FxsA
MLFSYLAALFIFMPMLELAVLFRLFDRVGAAPTLGLVVVTGLVGAFLARREGLKALQTIRRESAQGRLPAPALMDGALILTAGILLITPGLVTDTVGFLLLIPFVRAWVRGRLRQALAARFLNIP